MRPIALFFAGLGLTYGALMWSTDPAASGIALLLACTLAGLLWISREEAKQ